MNKKNAIIMLSHSFTDMNAVKMKSIDNCCKTNNLEVIKTIYNYDTDGSAAFEILIQIIKEQITPITVIIDQDTYISLDNVISCCVLGTLMKTDLIEIAVYQETYQHYLKSIEPTMIFFNKNHVDFLSAAASHFKWILNNQRQRN
jgi:hypothetical protein